MNEQNQRDSIMSMARGAFEERVDYEMDKVIQNILDPNTKATAKRKITLTIELTPDDERRTIGVSVTAKSTLAATNPVATALYVTSDGNGELVVAEMVPQVPGQMNMDGTQQEAPKLLKLVQHGYTDDEGNDKLYIPSGKCVLTAPGAGRTAYGAVSQVEQSDGEFHTYAGRRVPKYVSSAEGNSRTLTISSRPLMIPNNKNPFIVADVLTD
jgi:hypothetical protein